jgi:hypothetical protein
MHDVRRGKLIFLPASFQFATTRRDDVLDPLRLAAVAVGIAVVESSRSCLQILFAAVIIASPTTGLSGCGPALGDGCGSQVTPEIAAHGPIVTNSQE